MEASKSVCTSGVRASLSCRRKEAGLPAVPPYSPAPVALEEAASALGATATVRAKGLPAMGML